MKKIAKRAAALLFVVALVLSMMVVPASALKADQVEMDTSYLSREKCWAEAAKYVDVTGLSRPRIAREIYAHALADNIGYRLTELSETMQKLITKNINVDFRSALGTYLTTRGHVVELGGDSSLRERIYEQAWKNVHLDELYCNIHSKMDWNKVIDVNGNSDENGAKIQLYSANGTSAQAFALYKTGDWYNIFKKGTFQCLDVSGGVAASEIKIQLYEYNGTAAQDWAFLDTRDGDGSYYILNRLGFYLDACGGTTDNGTQIWTYTLNRTNAQKWFLSEAPKWNY